MRGSCLCGQVKFKINRPARSIVACHCNQCRKTSGHYVAAMQIATNDLQIEETTNITWYQSSAQGRRGFCSTCGSNLFWSKTGNERTSVMAGTIDGCTNLRMDLQIHTSSKADYYELPKIKIID